MESEKTTSEEARYISDVATFENPDFLSYCNKNFGGYPNELSVYGLAARRVLQENYLRWIEENKFETVNIKITTLEEVHNIYKKYFHIEDTKRIDVVLAVALSQKLEGIPIWMLIVGASGDMKSVQLNSLIGLEQVYKLHNLTSKSLVNGYKDKRRYPDLAPELNNKIIVIPDMAQILKLPPVEKAEVWAQLRDLYDGMAGKVSGMGSRASYDNIKVTLLAGSTPSIDGQILIHQDLGTRELIYRTKGNKMKKEVMQKCIDNEELEQKIAREIKEKTKNFLDKTEVVRSYINPEHLKELMKIATYITYMRATAEVDSYTNELRNYVYPEEPTRIIKQLKRLYICFMSLSKDYPEDRALKILWEIAKGSAFPIRVNIFEYLLNNKEEFSTSELAKHLKIGKKTAKRECCILWNMRLIECRQEVINSMFPDRTYDYWKIIMTHKFVKSLCKPTPKST